MAAGDVLLTQPVVKYLYDKYPKAHIYFYTLDNPLTKTIASQFAGMDSDRFTIKTLSIQNNVNPIFADILTTVDEVLDLKFDLDLDNLLNKKEYFSFLNSLIPTLNNNEKEESSGEDEESEEEDETEKVKKQIKTEKKEEEGREEEGNKEYKGRNNYKKHINKSEIDINNHKYLGNLGPMKANTTIKASSQIDYSRGKCRS
jgi:hypothetical protein